MGCVIEGERCTRCCEAITLKMSRSQLLAHPSSDAQFIREHWKPISKRRAKKKNPYLFQRHPRLQSAKAWRLYHCTALTSEGCGKYEDRPAVCSGYPLYGAGGLHSRPDYHPQCVEWKMIDVVQNP
ncbi:Fe-S-cluster containining protein [Microvirga lupini]|uniref:Fe-S-cluster containining protein n=1 Tax=Microvirga lupini TaxID=420324 RepID=A0A7W4YVY9_9HYPH|nr:YkgJ family cysteine cluster protein [Microvirga lupini]MBB3017689.1 Fe-S-cluster containining protein [Microvirga lupini]